MFTLKRIAFTVFVVNLVLTAYTVYFFVHTGDNLDTGTKHAFYTNIEELSTGRPNFSNLKLDKDSDNVKLPSLSYEEKKNTFTIEIWSKAAIGYYLWDHILGGNLNKDASSRSYIYGTKQVNELKFKFRSGPALTVQSLRQFLTRQNGVDENSGVVHMILVLNGREESNVRVAKQWLNELKTLQSSHTSLTFNLGVVMLGNENCFNSWIKPYLTSSGGFVKFLFVVYDWTAVDDETIFQWPLGVATYRNFPSPNSVKPNVQLKRPYLCNFSGTIYFNSSRAELMKFFDVINTKNLCLVKPRWKWLPNENEESREAYIHGLRLSDLTLSPIGMNHECYRIYEAVSYGSVPVLEQNLNHVSGYRSTCDHNAAYRLLRKHNAPFIYVRNWTQELPTLLEQEKKMSLEAKIQRRAKLLQWYENFKRSLKSHFVNVIREKFLIT